jgi:hypothetical protein
MILSADACLARFEAEPELAAHLGSELKKDELKPYYKAFNERIASLAKYSVTDAINRHQGNLEGVLDFLSETHLGGVDAVFSNSHIGMQLGAALFDGKFREKNNVEVDEEEAIANRLRTLFPEIKILLENAGVAEGAETLVGLRIKDYDYFTTCLPALLRTGTMPLLTEGDHALRSFARLTRKGLETLLQEGEPVRELFLAGNEESYKELFSCISESEPGWSDHHTREGFNAGAERFGYKEMFLYASNRAVSLHDIFVSMPAVVRYFDFMNDQHLAIAGNEPLDEKRFCHNVLLQVAQDKSVPYGKNAHQRLAEFVQKEHVPVAEILAKAEQYRNVGKIAHYIDGVGESPSTVIADWKVSMKRWIGLCDTLSRDIEALNALAGLESDGTDPPLVRMISELSFDEESNIDFKAPLQMVRDPSGFLGKVVDHSGGLAVKNIQPIHMTNEGKSGLWFPDMTPAELISAFANGALDDIQLYRPFSATVTVTLSSPDVRPAAEKFEDLTAGLRAALGNSEAGVAAQGNNTRKLFQGCVQALSNLDEPHSAKNVVKWLTSARPTYTEFVKYFGAAGTEESGRSIDEMLRLTFVDHTLGLPKNLQKIPRNFRDTVKRNRPEEVELRVSIQPKSSVDGIKAGNDTACCMPFGSAKNTQYTFNTGDAIFTVQYKTADNRWRLAAQSVLTANFAVDSFRIREAESQVRSGTPFHKITGRQGLQRQLLTIACDNVEVSAAFRSRFGGKKEELIRCAYQAGFKIYLDQAEALRRARGAHFNTNAVLIGLENSDALKAQPAQDDQGYSHVPNNFAFSPFLAYSDQYGDKIGRLRPEIPANVSVKKGRTVSEKPCYPRDAPLANDRLVYLRPEHVVSVATLHSQSFTSFDGMEKPYELRDDPFSIHNNLLTQDVMNRVKERPSLSIGHYTPGENGKDLQLTSYILAYESTVPETQDRGLIKAVGEPGTRFVHIDEWVVDEKHRPSAISVIREWMRIAKHHYGDEGVKIVTSARADTSYKVLHKLVQRLGTEVTINEVSTEGSGSDKRHWLVIEVGKEKSLLAKAKSLLDMKGLIEDVADLMNNAED